MKHCVTVLAIAYFSFCLWMFWPRSIETQVFPPPPVGLGFVEDEIPRMIPPTVTLPISSSTTGAHICYTTDGSVSNRCE